MTASDTAIEWARIAAAAAFDKKATDVLAFDVSDVLYITDIFVICSGSNPRQVAAIVDEIETRVKQAGAPSARKEGTAESRWVLIDFVDVVVHVQLDEERVTYGLERLWHDRPQIDFSDLAAESTA